MIKSKSLAPLTPPTDVESRIGITPDKINHKILMGEAKLVESSKKNFRSTVWDNFKFVSFKIEQNKWESSNVIL